MYLLSNDNRMTRYIGLIVHDEYKHDGHFYFMNPYKMPRKHHEVYHVLRRRPLKYKRYRY